MSRRRPTLRPYDTTRVVLAVVGGLVRKVPTRLRGWLYLLFAVVAVGYLLYGVYRGQLGLDDLLAALGITVGGTARGNLNGD